MSDRLAKDLRGFGPVGTLVSLGIVALGSFGGVPVLVWARLSDTDWRDLGFVRPSSWLGAAVIGIAFGVVFKLSMKALVMPLLGADPINQAYHYLVENPGAIPGMVFTVIVMAGFSEELVFRGFLFLRLGALLGRGARATAAIIVLSSLLFGLAHAWIQGRDGVVQATITGLVFGTIYARTRRIWTLVIAHAAFDLTAIAIIYWNAEITVAHFIFR